MAIILSILKCRFYSSLTRQPVKNEWWGAGVVICLERGADLHMAQLMPLTVSCFSKVQIGFTFLVPAHPGSPGQRAVKRVCVCVCVCVRACVRACVCVLDLLLNTRVLQDADRPETHLTVKKIFVSGIKDEIENEDLREYFAEMGEVVDVDVIVDKETKRKRGFAFVQFDDYDPVDKAVCE